MSPVELEAQEALERERLIRRDRMRVRAEAMVRRVQNTGRERLSGILEYACTKLFDEDDASMFAMIERMKRVPVPIDEFMDSREFFREQYEELWPQVREDLNQLNPDVLTGADPVYQYFDGGGIGTAKSFRAMTTQAYQLYFLTCFDRPQSLVRLPSATPLVFMFQSVSETVTRRVLYEPFRTMFTSMPYTKKWVRYDKYRENVLYLDQNIQVIPALATVQAMVGQAIISGILDEVNFMTVIENSKMVPGTGGQGGRYDQAEIAFNTMTRRRKSRFISRAPIPGCIAVASSTRYKNDFLDRKIRSVVENPERNTIVFRRAQYEVQPQDKYCGQKFRILVGTDAYPTRILKETDVAGTHYPEGGSTLNIPIEFKDEFVDDPDNALRDIVGIATDSIHPFMSQRHKIVEAIVRGRTAGLKSWVMKQNVELEFDGMPQINEANLPADRHLPRFVHVDLSKVSDRCGIAICKVAGFINENRGDDPENPGHVETLPHIVLEAAISIKPSMQRELDIAEVRNWVMLLKSFYGFNIYMVSYDGFQSAESIQAWRRAGIKSDVTSMDRTREPYEDLRRLYYEDRIDMIDNELARLELSNLEMNEKTGKIDHPPKGSKDISDAIAGACYRAARSRVNRNRQTVSDPDGSPVANTGRRTQVERRSINRR